MNALLFTNLYPSPREPTKGLFNLSTARALREFCNVRVVAPVPAWRRLRQPSELLHPVSDSRADIQATYPSYWAIPRVAPQWHAGAMYRSVRSHVRDVGLEFRFDVIVGAFAYPDVVTAARLASEAACPLVAIVMGSDMNKLAELPALRNQIREALMQASSVVAVSEGLRSKVIELGIPAERVVVQHNGVDGETFRIRDQSECRRTLRIPEKEKLVCFVGNLVYEKGPDVLVEAMRVLGLASAPDMRVAFIGDGSQKQSLISRCAELGFGERVSFLGRQSPDNVAHWLSASDVLCLPSRREGCPNVVLEALASGRPVVAARVGGVPELLNERNGVMVPPDNPSELAQALSHALHRSWNASELRATVPALTWQDVGRTLHGLLARAVRSHRAG